MAEQGVERRLAAILCADVVGYSRLMGADEVGTLNRLHVHREELIDPSIAQHHGRIVKTTGDGLLVEFASVVDAIQCAVHIQRAMAERNAGVPEDQMIQFRMGVNLGDIIVEGDDIFGDGVNVASRLEGLADPGGICIQRTVRDQIRDRLPLKLEDLGEQQVKNIARPVRVFRIILDEVDGEKAGGRAPAPGTPWRKMVLAGGLAALIAVAGVAVWLKPWLPSGEPAAVQGPTLPLPDKPSIAVLPFKNMSGDADQEYFADGMSEDLITDLSKISGLFVIARNSTFVYKGKSVDVKQVGRALGVKYVLEGSVRRAGDRVRINAQLIDAATGGHLWAERYDGSLADVFALQDEVTKKIITELAVRLTPGEQAGQARKETASVRAHDAFLRGWAHYLKATPADYAKAVPFLKEAVQRDPAYGRAYAALASVYRTARVRGWQSSLGVTPDDALERAMEYLEKAAEHPTPLAHQVASRIMTAQGAHDEAIAEAKRAIALNANDPAGYFAMARALAYAGRPAEGAGVIRKAMRLDPHYPPDYLVQLGIIQFGMGRFAEAALTLERAEKLAPVHSGALTFLVAAYGHLGRSQDAAPVIKRLLEAAKSAPKNWDMNWMLSVSVLDAGNWTFKEKADLDRLRAGLRKGGLPEFKEEWALKREDRLSGEEIRSISFGHTHKGRHPVSGARFTLTRTADGAFTARGLWSDTGTSRIDGERLCNRWTKYGESCAVIYRNREGNRERGNEYFLVQRSGVFPFIVAD